MRVLIISNYVPMDVLFPLHSYYTYDVNSVCKTIRFERRTTTTVMPICIFSRVVVTDPDTFLHAQHFYL